MRIGIAGGTGTVGRRIAAELAARGHEVVVLSRHPAEGAEHRRVDLATGEGLPQAVEGLDVVVDASNGTALSGTERLLAAERRAGVRHHVLVSIAGAEQVPLGYYRAKVAQEAALRDGGVPWSVVRATQFHGLVAFLFAKTAPARALPAPDVPLRPVDPRFVAAVAAEVAAGAPLLGIRTVAGPEVVRMPDLARQWRAATGRHAVRLPLPLPRRVGRPLRAGAFAPQAAETGGRTFSEWLAAA